MNIIKDKSMNVTIELNGIITSLIGPTNSGKTYFLKKLCNIVPNSSIMIDEEPIRDIDINVLKNNIMVVFDDNEYNRDYVAEELFYYLDILGYKVNEAKIMIDAIANYFNITDLLNKEIVLLSTRNRILVKILSFLICKPSILAIDNLFPYLLKEDINLLIKYIRKNNISLINVTSRSEDLFLSDNVIIMNNYKAVLTANAKVIFEGNSILPYLGIKLPFAVDLSHNLILYGIVDKIIDDKRKLVDTIWK